MKTIFDVDETDVSQMDPIGFANFVNHLLRAEGSRVAIPPVNIHTSLRVNTPDGGVDARVEDNGQQSDWIPLGTSVWQFKSGKDHEQAKIRKEFQKPGVQEVLKAGGSYRILVCDDLGNIQLRDRKKVLEDCCRDAGISSDCALIYAADKIAAWARRHPSMRLLISNPFPGGLYRWETWANQHRFKNFFQPDAQRSDLMAAIRRHSIGSASQTRLSLEGLAGVGKTRLVLEALRPHSEQDGLAERVLYAERPDDVPLDLFQWMQTTATAELVLVVDECSREESDRLERQAERSEGRIRLITVAQAQEAQHFDRSRADGFLLDKLNDECMRLLLEKTAPSLPRETASFVVTVASGFVKLAVALAAAVQRRPDLVSAHTLALDHDVHKVIRQFLVRDEADRRAMRAVALMTRVGWDDEMEQEGRTVTAFVGLDWPDARSRVARLVNDGLIAKQGRYRYVTPHLLAVWLASEVWSDRKAQTLDVLRDLPSPSSGRALLQRLSDLGDDPTAMGVAELLLGHEGLFHFETLNDQSRSEVFSILAKAYPRAGMDALLRILGGLPTDQLRQFSDGRRQIVWTLEKLAWFPETFADAARLLLALAEAENETWGNNASGTWVQLFGTHLGGSSVAALERHALIGEALDGLSAERQLLGVRAISRVFATHETSSVFGDTQTGRVAPERWRPKTWGEDWEARRSGLRLLDRALGSEMPLVQQAAEEVLLQQVCEIALAGLADDLLERLQALPCRDYDRRRKVREAAERIVMFERLPLTSEQRERFEKFSSDLAGESFSERTRRWVGQHIFADTRLQHQLGPDGWGREAAAMADEAMKEPDLLRAELEWLASDQAQHVYFFARRLGQLDGSHDWWPEIETLVRANKGLTLAAAYLQGSVDGGQPGWRDAILDEWVEEGKHLAPAVLDAVFRSQPPTEQDAERLFTLMDRGWLSAAQVSILTWGGQASALGLEGFQKIVEGMLVDEGEQATDGALSLLFNRLALRPEDEDALEALAWRALERPRSLTQDRFYGDELAKRYIPRDPLRVVRMVLKYVEDYGGPVMRDDDAAQLLEGATRLKPKEVWEAVASKLFPLCMETYHLYLCLKGWYGQVVGAEVLLAWAEQHPEDGTWQAASLVHVSGQPLDPLVREFLIRYKDDERVGDQLSAEFGSGSWVGPTSGWHRSRVEASREWMNDPHPAVRTWATREVKIHEQRLAEALLQEEEGKL